MMIYHNHGSTKYKSWLATHAGEIRVAKSTPKARCMEWSQKISRIRWIPQNKTAELGPPLLAVNLRFSCSLMLPLESESIRRKSFSHPSHDHFNSKMYLKIGLYEIEVTWVNMSNYMFTIYMRSGEHPWLAIIAQFNFDSGTFHCMQYKFGLYCCSTGN